MDSDIKIDIVFNPSGKKPIANAVVTLDTYYCGKVVIKGFSIWNSDYMNERLQEHVNITPPMVRRSYKYVDLVYVEDLNKWQQLEEQIYQAYKRASRRNQTEEVDPSEVPI